MGSPIPDSTSDPGRLAARYGGPVQHPLARRAVVAGLAVLLAGSLAWWVSVALVRSNPPVRWEVTAFDTVTDTSVTIEWVVDREAGARVDCVLRARDAAGEEVGRARVSVPVDDRTSVVLRHRLETSHRPVTGEVLTCAVIGD